MLVLIFIGYSVAEISEGEYKKFYVGCIHNSKVADTERSFDTEEDLLDYLDDRDMELERDLDLDRDLELEDTRPEGMTKAGQNKGFNVTCKKWTSRLVTVTPGAVGYLTSSADMKRCTVQYKVSTVQYSTLQYKVSTLAASRLLDAALRSWPGAAPRSCSPATTSTCPMMTPGSAPRAALSTPRQTQHQSESE